MKKIANEFLTPLEQTEIRDFFKSLINFDRKTRLQRREDAYYVHLGVSEYINENYEILIYDSVYKKYTETYVFFDSEGVYIKDLETLKGLFRENLYQEKKDFIQTKVNEFLDTFLSKHNLLNPEMLAFVRRWNSGKATQQDFDTKFHWETILNNEFDSFWWEQIVAPIAEEYVQQAQEILKGKVVFKRKHLGGKSIIKTYKDITGRYSDKYLVIRGNKAYTYNPITNKYFLVGSIHDIDWEYVYRFMKPVKAEKIIKRRVYIPHEKHKVMEIERIGWDACGGAEYWRWVDENGDEHFFSSIDSLSEDRVIELIEKGDEDYDAFAIDDDSFFDFFEKRNGKWVPLPLEEVCEHYCPYYCPSESYNEEEF